MQLAWFGVCVYMPDKNLERILQSCVTEIWRKLTELTYQIDYSTGEECDLPSFPGHFHICMYVWSLYSGKQTYKGHNHDLDMMVTLKSFHKPYCLLCQRHKCRDPVHSGKSGVLKAMVKECTSYTMDSTPLTFTETKSCRPVCWKWGKVWLVARNEGLWWHNTCWRSQWWQGTK